VRGCRPGSWPVVASLDGHLIPLPSSDRRFEEHEREQRERLVGAGEPGQVGERPSAHPRVAATENHGDDQQQRGEQRAEQQGQHQKMTPTTIGRIRFRSCTEASCTCPASRRTAHRPARGTACTVVRSRAIVSNAAAAGRCGPGLVPFHLGGFSLHGLGGTSAAGRRREGVGQGALRARSVAVTVGNDPAGPRPEQPPGRT